MKIENLISDKNRELFDRVNKIYPIDLVLSKTDTWSSQIKNGVGIISYCKTEYPEECFTHELLHFDTQIKGYKRLKIGFSAFDTTEYFPILMSAIDNELQHHKMFPEYLKLGYSKERFYIDNDTETEKYLRSVSFPIFWAIQKYNFQS